MSENLGSLVVDITANTTQLAAAQIAVQRLAGNVAASSTKMAASMETFNKSLVSISQRMRSMGWLATTVLTVPILAVGAASGKMASEFEFSMRKIESLVGVGRDQVQKWEKEILALSPATGRGPQELADALYFITSSGVKGAEAMQVLEASAKAAAVGLGETKAVADLVTSAMNAYGKESLSASQATDILVAAVREGKLEASDLATKLGMVLPIASAMGVSFMEVAATSAAMSRTGTNASMAAVQLRQVLVSLLKPSKRAEDTLNNMNTSSEELRKTIREKGLLAALLDLKDLSQEYGETIMARVFGNVRALTGVLDILGENLTENIEIFDKMSKSAGDMEKAYAIAADTIKMKYSRELAKLKVSQIEFGEIIAKAFLPILQDLILRVEKVTKWFAALSEEQQRSKIKWMLFLAILGPLSLALSVLGLAISTVITIGTAFIGVLKWIRVQMILLNAAIVTNPYFLAVIAVMTLITAYTFLRKKQQEVVAEQKQVNKVMEEAQKLNEAFVSIRDQAPVIGQMNARQLSEYEAKIKQQIALEQDFSLQVKAEYENRLMNEEQFAQTTENLHKDTNKTISTLQGQQTTSYGSFLNDRLDGLKRTLEQEIIAENDRLGRLKKTLEQEIIAEIDANQTKLNAYEAYLQQIQKRSEELKSPEYLGAEKKVIMNNLADSLYYLENQIYALKEVGVEFDGASAKADLLNEALLALARLGYNTTETEMIQLAAALKKLQKEMADVTKIKTAKDRLEEYGKTLNEITLLEERRAALNKNTGDTSFSYENMFKKIGASGFGASADTGYMKQVQQDLAGAAYMNNLFGDSLDTLDDQINIVKNAMTNLYKSEEFKAGSEGAVQTMAKLNAVYDDLISKQDEIGYSVKRMSNILSSSIINMAEAIGNAFVNTQGAALALVGVILQTGQQIVQMLLAEAIAATIAKNAMMPWGLIGAAVAIGALMALYQKSVSKAAEAAANKKQTGTGMANGGIVPPGYPNDSFPARLTSGEKVIPLGHKDIDNVRRIEVTVKGKVEGQDLVFIQEQVQILTNRTR